MNKENIFGNFRMGVAILAVLVAGAAVSGQSLWIDEANSAEKAIEPTLAAFWNTLQHARGSDMQMPLYMLYLWAWEKVFGASEWCLRAANLPFFFLSLGAWIWAWSGNWKGWLTAGMTCLMPMVWIYVDEARPYLMQFSGACVLLAVIIRIFDDPKRATSGWDMNIFFLGMFLTMGSSLLGVPFAGMALLCVLGLIFKNEGIAGFTKWGMRRGLWVALPCFLILGAYFAWTLSAGARASSVGGTGAGSLAFSIYELFGFTGMGPGRLGIRAEGINAFKLFLWPLAFLAIGWALLLVQLFCKKSASFKLPWLCLGLYLAIPCLFILALGIVSDFRVLGRHLFPAAPVLLLVLLFAGSQRMFWIRLAVIWVLAGWAVSDLEYRFGSRHAKDDYRGASQFARREVERGKTIFWAADPSAARYYGLKPERSSGPVWETINPRTDQMASMPEPDFIVLSKKDIYDAYGAIDDYMKQRGWKTVASYQAFMIYQRPDPR